MATALFDMKPESFKKESLKNINQYQITDKLGSGTHGSVYRAIDTRLDRPVVLKIGHSPKASHQNDKSGILEEARLASAIQHPNVSAIYEVGEFRSQLYIVMQYVPGQTLKELIAREPLNLQLILSLGIQIAEGLAEAHRLGILHRDLKPANIMITDGGLVKILDFGLAKRRKPVDGAFDINNDQASTAGTTAYMAPEQFITYRSSEQSDIYALGILLYEMATGSHPFSNDLQDQTGLVAAIKYATPRLPRLIRPELPEELERIIGIALNKQPANRFDSVIQISKSLKLLMKTLNFEVGVVPGEKSAVLPSPGPNSRRKESTLTMLAEKFLQTGNAVIPDNSIAVLPFQNLGNEGQHRYYGLALADTISSRLARLSSLAVRPPNAFLALSSKVLDVIKAGRKLQARYCLTGSYRNQEESFTLDWQLTDVVTKKLLAGDTVVIPSLDLIKIQTEISEEVFTILGSIGIVQDKKLQAFPTALPEEVSEQYLKARALLSRFLWGQSDRQDLERARKNFEDVVKKVPWFASASSGLGMTHLHYVINGFGGLTHFMSAQRYLEGALTLDTEHMEAKIYRAYTYLWRGEKENARRDIKCLLRNSGIETELYYGASVIIQLDGLYDEALQLLAKALESNPVATTRIYNRRARIYNYQGRLDMAWREVEKGLALEPNHPLLLTTQAYLYFREGRYQEATYALETVLNLDPYRRLAYPTLAMCYIRNGERSKAASLITDELLAAAVADCEMAYRLATYCVVEENFTEAFHWLRKAIYLGNQNYPWILQNPVWSPLKSHREFKMILEDLHKSYLKNQQRWKRFLSEI